MWGYNAQSAPRADLAVVFCDAEAVPVSLFVWLGVLLRLSVDA